MPVNHPIAGSWNNWPTSSGISTSATRRHCAPSRGRRRTCPAPATTPGRKPQNMHMRSGCGLGERSTASAGSSSRYCPWSWVCGAGTTSAIRSSPWTSGHDFSSRRFSQRSSAPPFSPVGPVLHRRNTAGLLSPITGGPHTHIFRGTGSSTGPAVFSFSRPGGQNTVVLSR